MSISENIIITNRGNATAHFNWLDSGNGVYLPLPKEDEVDPGCSKTCKVTFTPGWPRPDDEMISLKIRDGNTIDIKCSGVVNDSKCQFSERQLDFGNVPVGIKTKDEMLNLKNMDRVPAIFHVICDNEELTITPTRGKI
jgi:hypothetical protein